MSLVLMLDTQIYDLLVADLAILDKLQACVRAKQVVILTTHVQEDELDKIPDAEKRIRVAYIPHQLVPTSDFVLNISRLGMARLGTGTLVETIRKGNLRHTKDALIAATADYEGATLVTEDGLLLKRARGQGLTAWAYADLEAWLTTQPIP